MKQSAATHAQTVTRIGRRSDARSGQSVVEFALASVVFLMVVFGTFDIGRAVFQYSELTNAVREGARYGKFAPTDTAGIRGEVVESAPSLGLSTGAITVSCSGSCEPMVDKLVVSAQFEFTAITQAFLGISPITISSTASVAVE